MHVCTKHSHTLQHENRRNQTQSHTSTPVSAPLPSFCVQLEERLKGMFPACVKLPLYPLLERLKKQHALPAALHQNCHELRSVPIPPLFILLTCNCKLMQAPLPCTHTRKLRNGCAHAGVGASQEALACRTDLELKQLLQSVQVPAPSRHGLACLV